MGLANYVTVARVKLVLPAAASVINYIKYVPWHDNMILIKAGTKMFDARYHHQYGYWMVLTAGGCQVSIGHCNPFKAHAFKGAPNNSTISMAIRNEVSIMKTSVSLCDIKNFEKHDVEVATYAWCVANMWVLEDTHCRTDSGKDLKCVAYFYCQYAFLLVTRHCKQTLPSLVQGQSHTAVPMTT